MTKNIAIFASGTGSNARKIVEYFQDTDQINVGVIVSNKSTAKVLQMAADYEIPTIILNRQEFYETENILKKLYAYNVDYLILAGFLWLIPKYLVQSFENQIVNIHPALLPKYGGPGMYGINVHKAVKATGETESGMTIHFVNEKYDDGAIFFQAKCLLEEHDTPEDIASKVLALEHKYFPKVIESIIRGKK
ncbi:MAG: phosphoribosylglycinamide formyltransferase-1 [Paraglaciecola sp.]